MSLRTFLGSGLSFAHLGVRTPRAAHAEGDEPPADDKKSKRAKGEQDDDDEHAEDDDPNSERAEGGSDDEGEGDDKKSKRAKGSKDDSGKGGDEDDDDSDEEMRGKSAAAVARRRERARCAAIFASPYAQGREAFAAHLAFNTTNTRSEAIGLLKNAPAAAAPAPAPQPSRAAHPSRAAANPNVTPNAAPPKSAKQQTADSWAGAFQAVGVTLRGSDQGGAGR